MPSGIHATVCCIPLALSTPQVCGLHFFGKSENKNTDSSGQTFCSFGCCSSLAWQLVTQNIGMTTFSIHRRSESTFFLALKTIRKTDVSVKKASYLNLPLFPIDACCTKRPHEWYRLLYATIANIEQQNYTIMWIFRVDVWWQTTLKIWLMSYTYKQVIFIW